MNKLKWAALSMAVLMLSCVKEIENTITKEPIGEVLQKLKPIKLGKDIAIPYTTANMNKALHEVLLHFDSSKPYGKSKFSTKSSFAKKMDSAKEIEIVPSHYYYRFLPKDSVEYVSLIKDTILDVTNIPMHKEIVEEGDVYDDPEIQGDEKGENYGWLYAVLPYDYDFPNHIKNEKLEDMYFAPELDQNEPLAKGETAVKIIKNKTTKELLTVDRNGVIFEYLELEALKLTNNLDQEELNMLRFFLPNDSSGNNYTFEEAFNKGFQMSELILDYDSVLDLLNSEDAENSKKTYGLTSRRRKWTPHGKITVYDDVLGENLPVRGAKILVRKWGFLVIKKAYTNNNGEFRTSSTRTKRVKYSVYFLNERKKFIIKAGTIFVNAKHRGTRRYKRKGWFQNFTYGRSRFYAQVHNATYDYYDRAVGKFGLIKPNWNWLRISAKYNKDVGNHFDVNPFGRFGLIPYSEIRVGRMENGWEMASDQIYGLVTHELTHASHYRMDRSFFINLRGFGCTLQTMAESWAVGVETVVTNDRYLDLNPNYIGSNNINNLSKDFNKRLYNSTIQDKIVKHRSNEEYTPIVIDLVDDYNQNYRISDIYPIDRVKGYKLKQIQTSLNNSRGPHRWKESLIEKHYNSTEGFVNELFDSYMFDNCK
ncbi:MAG: hypothetical protein COA50_05495 [Flavobacteriaceae bacterium]|nr:MAG: hypothetical protein COA50_05495 [Flavobacteriaceae bacterium]